VTTNRVTKYHRVAQLAFALVACSVLVSPVWAQRDRPQRGMMPGPDLAELALQPAVSDELKLTPDQIGGLKQLGEPERRGRGDRDGNAEERQKKRQEAAEAREKKVAEILQPAQFSRLKQISWQVQGSRAFGSPQVASALNLTADQQEKISEVLMGSAEGMRNLFTSGGLQQGDSEEIKAANKAKIAEVDKAALDKIMAVLTPDQQSKWKELTGEPFAGKLDLPRGGGRDRRRRAE
jgi:hypothetical protein